MKTLRTMINQMANSQMKQQIMPRHISLVEKANVSRTLCKKRGIDFANSCNNFSVTLIISVSTMSQKMSLRKRRNPEKVKMSLAKICEPYRSWENYVY